MNFIREAKNKDISNLMEVVNKCFPHSVYWALGNERAFRRWEVSIQSEASEVWLCESATGVQGFSLNILDEVEWKSSMPLFDVSGFRKFILAIKNPKRGYLFGRKRFGRKQVFNTYEFSRLSLEPRLFVDLFAVTPGSRGKGVASALLENNIKRARQLGRCSVVYNVDRDNFPMLILLKKHGFVAVAGNQKQVTFAGMLT